MALLATTHVIRLDQQIGLGEDELQDEIVHFPLRRLAEVYQERLSTEPLARRFAHHISHVASEGWLCQELAFLVNEEAHAVGLSGWYAELERERVDVRLVNSATGAKIYIECKQVPPDYWRCNWREVYKDLGYPDRRSSGAVKPVADYAVCVAPYPKTWSAGTRPQTSALYEKYLSSVPSSRGKFVPFESVPSLPLLEVVADSHPFPLHWARPTGEILRDLYCRIWWVRLADNNPVGVTPTPEISR